MSGAAGTLFARSGMTLCRVSLCDRTMIDVSYLDRNGQRIAYRKRVGKGPGVIWLGGFRSDMDGTKAEALDAWAARRGRACLRFDYFGHGHSSGDFVKGTISHWRDDALAVIDALSEGPQIFVGSSMGGWIAMLAAMERPQRVATLVLIAPAADFTEVLMWDKMDDATKRAVLDKGVWQRESKYAEENYPITRALIEDGRKNLILGAHHALPYPVRILQGMADPDVPWTHAMKLVDTFTGDVTITLVKNGDHRLSTPVDLKLLESTLDGLCE